MECFYHTIAMFYGMTNSPCESDWELAVKRIIKQWMSLCNISDHKSNKSSYMFRCTHLASWRHRRFTRLVLFEVLCLRTVDKRSTSLGATRRLEGGKGDAVVFHIDLKSCINILTLERFLFYVHI
jgi:hypothetical protein